MTKKYLLLGLVGLASVGMVSCQSYQKSSTSTPSSAPTSSESKTSSTTTTSSTSSGTSTSTTSSSSSKPSTSYDPTKLKTITYLASVDSGKYKDILTGIIDDFNEVAMPNGYQIKTETPGGDYYQALKLKIAANKCPDVFLMEYGSFSSSFQKAMLDLQPLVDASTKLDQSDIWDLNDYYKVGGELKALIKDFSPDFMLIYNKTMLDKYNAKYSTSYTIPRDKPMDWEDFYDLTSKIQKEYTPAGKSFYGTSLGFEGVKHLHELVQSTGANMYINDDKNLNKTDPNVRESYAWFLSLQKDNVTQNGTDLASEIQKYGTIQAGNNGKAPASYTAGSTTSEQEMFKQQRCFSIFNGLYSFPQYGFYDITDFEWDIAPHPVFNNKDGTKEPFGTTSAMVSHALSAKLKNDAGKKEWAWKFLEYFQTEGLTRLAKIAYNIPGNKSVAGSDAFLVQENPDVQDMVNFYYNFVNAGYCKPTVYNKNIGYQTLATIYQTAFTQYYDTGSKYKFNDLLDYVDQKIQNQ